MATKLSVDSIYKPAPRWWRRLERALLIAFIPAAVTMLQGWTFDDPLTATRLMLFINIGLVALVKGIGMLLSNGEDYVQLPHPQEPPAGSQ